MPGLIHPRSAAIVGAGPAGLYLLAALLKAETFEQIDVYESAPAPFGLVRYGVAPDHPKTRGIARVLAAGFGSARARFLGNVHVGEDVTLDELRSGYDAVVFASGMRGDRRLGIPGEDLAGSLGASELVDWYTGHPEACPIELPVGLRSAAVIGAGNVALDVARLLTRDPKSLHTTSMPRHVVDVFTASTLTDVHLIARRGPAFARFTSPELHEIGDLEGVDVVADPADVILDDADRAELERRRQGKVTVKVLGEWLDRQPGDAPRRIHFHFWRRPVRILGSDQVSGIELAATRGEGAPLTIPVELVVRAIGYHGEAVSGLPFEPDRGVIPSQDGRVLDGSTPLPGVYVTGWLRRGPSGVIGTNRPDAGEVAASVLADIDALPTPEATPDHIDRLLAERAVRVLGWKDWLRLEAHEKEIGDAHGGDPVVMHELDAILRMLDAG